MTIQELVLRLAQNITQIQTLISVSTIPGITPAMRLVIATYGLTLAAQVHRDAESLESAVAALVGA